MTQASFVSKFPGTILVFAAALLVGCTPLHVSDIHTTSTPRSQLFDVAELAREPVATLGLLTSASLQGFNPPLSHALNAAFWSASRYSESDRHSPLAMCCYPDSRSSIRS